MASRALVTGQIVLNGWKVGASILRANAGSEAEFVLGAAILEAEQFAAGADRDQDMTAVCVRFR